jgi:hypothetical protein
MDLSLMVVLSMLKPPESAGVLGSGSRRLRVADGGISGGFRWSGMCAQEMDYSVLTGLCRLIYAPIEHQTVIAFTKRRRIATIL